MSGSMAREDFARAQYHGGFDSTCDVIRGGVKVHEGIECAVEIPNDRNQQIEGQSLPIGALLVAVPMEYSLNQGDYVVERGRTLEVIVPDRDKSFQIRREALAVEIGPAS